MEQAHVLISGFVQGIGFRHFVKNKALELGLTGWVRNLPDGRVEALFQGSKEKIEEMIGLCEKGPFLAAVENVEVKWDPSDLQEKFASFEIRM